MSLIPNKLQGPTLICLRGIPGAGKSTFAATLAKSLNCNYYEADMWMLDLDGNYKYDKDKLQYCHDRCKALVADELYWLNGLLDPLGTFVIVSNTSTSDWEVQTYQDIAEEHGANFVSLIVENRHGNGSVHGVPDENLKKMRQRLAQSLKL